MRLDIHVHSNHSDCSGLDVTTICAKVTRDSLPLFTVTDHGNARACEELELSCRHAAIVFGVEVTAREGDFLVYSLDSQYIRSLSVYQDSVTDLHRDKDTAIIWAHPRVPHRESIGWASPCEQNGDIDHVVAHIDGIEIFNGTMLGLAVNAVVQRTYFSNLLRIAQRANLAMTGGSDAHDPVHFYTAWTTFDEQVKTPQDFISALKEGRVEPGYDHNFYKINVP